MISGSSSLYEFIAISFQLFSIIFILMFCPDVPLHRVDMETGVSRVRFIVLQFLRFLYGVRLFSNRYEYGKVRIFYSLVHKFIDLIFERK